MAVKPWNSIVTTARPGVELLQHRMVDEQWCGVAGIFYCLISELSLSFCLFLSLMFAGRASVWAAPIDPQAWQQPTLIFKR